MIQQFAANSSEDAWTEIGANYFTYVILRHTRQPWNSSGLLFHAKCAIVNSLLLMMITLFNQKGTFENDFKWYKTMFFVFAKNRSYKHQFIFLSNKNQKFEAVSGAAITISERDYSRIPI